MVVYCHDCGYKEGELHDYGCDEESCPFCGGQLISCECCYTKLGINPDEEPVYSEGLNNKQEALWVQQLTKKGRIPFIKYPNICARCGKLYPDMFTVPNDEWNKYVELRMRRRMLCRSCYNHIKNLINEGVT